MKRLTWLGFIVWAIALTGSLNAQKSDTHRSQTVPKAPVTAPKVQHVEGSIKALPVESTFVVNTPKNGEVTVRASKAKIMHRGAPSNIAALRPGTVVEVTGKINGSVCTADLVNVVRFPRELRHSPRTKTGA